MILLLVTGMSIALAGYLYRLNYTLSHTPVEAKRQAIPTLTKGQVRETYERLRGQQIPWKESLPQGFSRRYIVVGGSGEYSYDHLHMADPFADDWL